MKPKIKNHFRAHQLSVWLRLIPELHRTGMEDVTLRHNMFHNHENNLYDGVVKNDRHIQNPTNRQSFSAHNGTVAEIIQSITTLEPFLTTCTNIPSSITNTVGMAVHANITHPIYADETQGISTYSTTLGLTIAIGCTLLVLNVLIFAGVYYQRDKTRMEIKTLREHQLHNQQQLSGNTSDSSYCTKSLVHGYQSSSIMLDIEPDTSSVILNNGSTLPRSSQQAYKYASNLATIPRHFQSTKTHITKSDEMTMTENKPHVYSDCYLSSSANGSIVIPPSALPKPPPPPKSSPPPESQPLLHGGHMMNSIPQHQNSGILKVPAAAISEMRV